MLLSCILLAASSPQMATIHVNNVWARATGAAAHIEQRVQTLEALLDGCRLRHTDGRFLAGIVPLVADATTEIVDLRDRPIVAPDFPVFLRDYQLEAVLAAMHNTRGIIQSPTGSGKTAIGAGLVATLKFSWAYLVPTPSLAVAAAAWMREHLGEAVGEVHGSCRRIEGRIMVATFDSLHSYGPGAEFLARAQGLIVDEVHRVAPEKAMACVLHAESAYYRIGMSATPLQRSDEKNVLVQALVGPIIHRIPVKLLEERGRVAKLVVTWIDCPQAISFRGRWPDFYDEYVVRSEVRNVGIAAVAAQIDVPGLVLVKTKEHAQILRRMISAAAPDRKVEVVDGDIPVKERTELIARINNGTVDVVVATKVFFEGIDAPEIVSVIPATAYQSAIETIQMAGRGSRPTTQKQICNIYEFADRGHRWLEEHTLARYEAYREAGYDVPAPWPPQPPIDLTGVWRWVVVFLALCGLFSLYTVLRYG